MRGRRSCSTAGHEAGGDHALSNTAVFYRVGGDTGWEQPSVQWSCGGEVIWSHWPVMLLYMLFSDLVTWSIGGIYSPVALLFISYYWSFVQLSDFCFFELWENTYSSAIYFLVGGTVCSYVCIQESTLQCNFTMSHFVCSAAAMPWLVFVAQVQQQRLQCVLVYWGFLDPLITLVSCQSRNILRAVLTKKL